MYNDLVDFAYILVKQCNDMYKNQKNPMGYYSLLNGLWNYKLSIGEGDHNYYAAIDGIFKFQEKSPKEPVKEGYLEALKKQIKYVNNEQSIISTISMLMYQMQKQNETPGIIDLNTKELFIILKNTLNEKKSELKKNIDDFDAFIEEQNTFIEKNVGMHV